MFFNKNGFAVSLLSFLQGTGASYNPIGGPITGDVTNYETTVSGTPSATVIFADVVAPSGSSAVVEFAKSTPPAISTPGASNTPSVPPCRGDPCTVTLTPVRFAPHVSTWIQHLTTTVTVPGASTPVIHFSPIQTPVDNPTAAPNASPSDDPTSSQPVQSNTPGPDTKPTSHKPHNSETPASNNPGSSTPYDAGSTKGQSPSAGPSDSPSPSDTASSHDKTPVQSTAASPPSTNKPPRASGASTSNNPKPSPKHSGLDSAGSTTAKDTAGSTTADTASESNYASATPSTRAPGSAGSSGPGTSGKPAGSKTSGKPASSASTPGGSTGSNVSDSSTPSGSDTSSTAAGSITPSTTPGSSPTSSGFQSSNSPSTSASLQDAPDSEAMSSMLSTLSGTSSADVAALLSAEETKAPATTEAWENLMSEIPTATASSDRAAQTTEGVALAGWLTKFNDNVQSSDLTDKDTYNKVRENLSKTKDDIKNYVENRKSSDNSGDGSSDDSCGSGGGLFSIFKAASCFVNKASNEIEDGSKDIGNLINSGWDLTSQGISEIEKELPDVDDITPEIEQQFKENIKHFSGITESLENLEKENEKEDDNKSSSQSQSSTDSTSSTSTDSQTTTGTETTSTSTSSPSSSPIICSPGCSACEAAEKTAGASAAAAASSFSADVSASISSKRKRSRNDAQQTGLPFKKKRADEDDDPYAYMDDPNRSGLEPINAWYYENRLEYYETQINSEGSTKVDHRDEGNIYTSSQFINFDNSKARVYVEGLEGCTAVGIISEQGAWLSHFWEGPTMRLRPQDTSQFQTQVEDVLKTTDDDMTTPPYPLGESGKPLHTDNNVRIFIMTPRDGDDVMYPETLGRLENLLTGQGAKWEGVEITRFLYDKPDEVDMSGIDDIKGDDDEERARNQKEEITKRQENLLLKYWKNSQRLNGRMMIEFAPRQTMDPDDDDNHDLTDPPVAMYRVLMGTENHQEMWCPHTNQQNGDGNNQKRAAACTIGSSSSTSGSSSVASSTGSSSTDSTSSGISSGSSSASSTTSSSPMCDLEVYGTDYSVCACSSTNGGHSLSHTIRKPTSTDCSNIKTFPMTSFMQVATATQTSYICANTPKDLNGNMGAFCQCSSTVTNTATTTDTSQTVAVVSLPYVMGSKTVLGQCADITEFPSDPILYSNTQTQPTRTFSDFTSTDFANNDVVYVYTAGAEYYNYDDYGIASLTGPATYTTGVGDPVSEIIHDYSSTNDGGTVYAYAQATGDGDGDVSPAGSPTATSLPEPTHNCVKFVVPAPGDVYNSATEQYLFTMWGIEHWLGSDDIERDIEDVLKDHGVTADISIEKDTGRWGTVAMWNNGRESEMTDKVRNGLEDLGSGKPNCKWIYKTGFDVNFPVKDSAVEEMDWIYENHPKFIKSPYPLTD